MRFAADALTPEPQGINDERMYQEMQRYLQQNPAPSIDPSQLNLDGDRVPAAEILGPNHPPTMIDLYRDKFLLHSPNSPLT